MRLHRGKLWCLLCAYCCALLHQTTSTPVTGKATPENTREGDKLAAKDSEPKGTQTIIRPTNVFREDDLKLDAKGSPSRKELKRDLRPFEWLYNTLDNYLRCAYSNGADCEHRLVSSIKLGEIKDRQETDGHRDVSQMALKEFIPYGNSGSPYGAYPPSLLVAPLQGSATTGWFDKPFSGLWKPAFPMYQSGPSTRGSGYGDTSFDPYVPMIPLYYGQTGGSSEIRNSFGPQPWGKHHAIDKPFEIPFAAFSYNREPGREFAPSDLSARFMGGKWDSATDRGFYNGPWGSRIEHHPHFFGNPMPFPMMQMHIF